MSEWILLTEAEVKRLDGQVEIVRAGRRAYLDHEQLNQAVSVLGQESRLGRMQEAFGAPVEFHLALSEILASPYADRPGAITAIMASGRVQGDYLVIHPETYARLRATYGLEARCAGCGR